MHNNQKDIYMYMDLVNITEVYTGQTKNTYIYIFLVVAD